MSRYAFDTGTADFHICARCGVVPVVTSRIEGRLYAVVNTKTIEDFDPSSLQHTATSFDGESEEARLSRRKRHWIANVEFSESDM